MLDETKTEIDDNAENKWIEEIEKERSSQIQEIMEFMTDEMASIGEEVHSFNFYLERSEKLAFVLETSDRQKHYFELKYDYTSNVI